MSGCDCDKCPRSMPVARVMSWILVSLALMGEALILLHLIGVSFRG